MTREADIMHENGPAWVYRDKAKQRYTVFVAGPTHSVSDSAYHLTADGLSIAKARADYLARRQSPHTIHNEEG